MIIMVMIMSIQNFTQSIENERASSESQCFFPFPLVAPDIRFRVYP